MVVVRLVILCNQIRSIDYFGFFWKLSTNLLVYDELHFFQFSLICTLHMNMEYLQGGWLFHFEFQVSLI